MAGIETANLARDAVKISGLKVPAMMSERGSQEFRMDFMISTPRIIKR